jgi:hypothetical protein
VAAEQRVGPYGQRVVVDGGEAVRVPGPLLEGFGSPTATVAAATSYGIKVSSKALSYGLHKARPGSDGRSIQ